MLSLYVVVRKSDCLNPATFLQVHDGISQVLRLVSIGASSAMTEHCILI